LKKSISLGCRLRAYPVAIRKTSTKKADLTSHIHPRKHRLTGATLRRPSEPPPGGEAIQGQRQTFVVLPAFFKGRMPKTVE
jgi:hypothetical protein